ncbi:hypothetical protein VE00_10565 [Pseudogymnoascus sp. WSF 3629]|nr:hypothetical protein VE00_10565 [Pseudogymnoascus sp. WSF 3629]
MGMCDHGEKRQSITNQSSKLDTAKIKGMRITDLKSELDSMTDPVERRRIQNVISQRIYREKAKQENESRKLVAENQLHAGNSYSVPNHDDLGDDIELSGLPWGGPSIRHIINRERPTARGKFEVFVSVIINSDLVDDDTEEVRKNCLLWAYIGGRYEKIASSLGGAGSLMLLPGDISRYKLERGIPMNKGFTYTTFIDELETRGICEEADELDAHKVANGILEYLSPTSSCTWLTPLVSEIHSPKYQGGQSASDPSKNGRPQSIRPNNKRRQFHSSNNTSRRSPSPRSSTPLNNNRRYGMELLYHAAIQVSSDMYPEPQLQVHSNDEHHQGMG